MQLVDLMWFIFEILCILFDSNTVLKIFIDGYLEIFIIYNIILFAFALGKTTSAKQSHSPFSKLKVRWKNLGGFKTKQNLLQIETSCALNIWGQENKINCNEKVHVEGQDKWRNR